MSEHKNKDAVEKPVKPSKPSRKRKAYDETANMIEEMMKDVAREQPLEVPIEDETTPGLNDLPSELLYQVFKHLLVPDRANPLEVPQQNFIGSYGTQRQKMLKNFWRLRGVSRRICDFLDNSVETKKFERPGVGLRITPKPRKQYLDEEVSENMVLVYVYGARGDKYPCQCVHISELQKAIRPCLVKTNLVVQGFVISDLLINSLKNIDLTLVEEVRFHDVRGVSLENQEESLKDLVSLFPNAMTVEFLGRRKYFDPAQVFPATLAKTLEMDRNDEECRTADLLVKYRHVSNRKARRTRKERNQRAIRRLERDELEREQNRIAVLMHVPGGDFELAESDPDDESMASDSDFEANQDLDLENSDMEHDDDIDQFEVEPDEEGDFDFDADDF